MTAAAEDLLAKDDRLRDYQPIGDYALIGDCHGSALVARGGSIDWCCLTRFDDAPVFCRLLDARQGGYLSVAPAAEHTVARSYIGGTNVLRTVFTAADGAEIGVTDFMPVGRRPGSGLHNYVALNAPHWLVRIVDVVRGSVRLKVGYRPSRDFGRKPPGLAIGDGCIAARGKAEGGAGDDAGPVLYFSAGRFVLKQDTAEAVLEAGAGERFTFVLADRPVAAGNPADRVEQYLCATLAFWREWIAYCRYEGPYRAAVRRSLLTIKLLIYAPTGAIVAAPTTSLPESIGGNRNWDYRYCWLRDATFCLYALALTGYGGEGRRFGAYLPRVCAATAPDLSIMYAIDGEAVMDEAVIDTLDGYGGSRPVRVGNAARLQRQMDVYGEMLDWALMFETLGGRIDAGFRATLTALADFVAKHWHEPDQGIWEMRGPPLQHVHGKIMSWVALDRAIRLLGRREDWEAERDRIVAEVQAHGTADRPDHLVQSYGERHADAALLTVPMTGFPLGSGIVKNTIEAVEAELRSGDFVYRYRREDGVAGSEGAFLICSYWLVDALLHIDREKEAEALFERLLACGNDVGLHAEEVDVHSHAFLGNFPQAYTHLAMIVSAAHLELHRSGGAAALSGSHSDRAKRTVSATLGWRAVWAAFQATWRVGRLRSSKDSMLALEPRA